MTRPEYRALVVGVALLAAASLLLELLSFRMVAATLGRAHALFAAILMPAAGAFGAMVVARRSPLLGSMALVRSASHTAAWAGTFAVLGVIGLTWTSQKVAIARGHGEWIHVAVMLASCALPALFSGAAIALALRRGVRRVGRFTFAESLGAALACVAVPLMLWGGAPRAAIGNGLIYASAALCFAWVARHEKPKPRTAVIATLPLAVVSLIAGDVGSPWLKMRFDHLGRRSQVAHTHWSAQGVISVRKPKRGKTILYVDREHGAYMARVRKNDAPPTYMPHDIGYRQSGPDKGPVLIVGATGGREVAVAMSKNHPRVDAISLHATLVNDFLLDRYASATGRVIHDQERVKMSIGDGLAGLARLPADYQHIVVMNWGRFHQAAPRLLSHHDRLFTAEAVARYLSLLREDGNLVLRYPREGSPSVLAAVSHALGGPVEQAREHVLLCTGPVHGVMLVMKKVPTVAALHSLKKRCKKSRLTVDYPLEKPRRGRPGEKTVERNAALVASFDGARLPTDDRPFLASPTGSSYLKPATVEALRALPSTKNGSSKDKRKPGGNPADEEGPPADMTPAGVAAAGLGVAVLLVLLGMLVPPPRTRDGEGSDAKPIPLPRTLRWAFPFLGAALALCMFSVGDQLLRVLGDAAYGWALIIPLGLVGAASGRLWVDTISRERLRTAVTAALGAALAWLVIVHFLRGSIAGLADAGMAVQLTMALFVLVVSGWLLGAPLAAGMRLVAAWDPGPVSWCWGAHLGGWAIGSGCAALLVYYVGVAKLWPLGLVAFAMGAMLLALGARDEAPQRWFVRRVR